MLKFRICIVESFFILVIIETCLYLGLNEIKFFTLLRVASNFLVVLYRREWAALGNMSKEDAMVEFVKLLNRCCHLFSTYVASHKIEKEEQEKKR